MSSSPFLFRANNNNRSPTLLQKSERIGATKSYCWSLQHCCDRLTERSLREALLMIRCLVLLVSSGWLLQAAQAQVVQLPSMHTFTIRTSVLVPDSGGAYL